MDLLSQIIAAFVGIGQKQLDQRLSGNRRTAKTLMNLYKALKACHISYSTYTSDNRYKEFIRARCYHGPKFREMFECSKKLQSQLSHLREKWYLDIEHLAKLIWERRDILEIWNPQLYDTLYRYTAGETHAYQNEQIPDEERSTNLAKYFSNFTLHRDDGTVTFLNDFDEARVALASFIREHTELTDFF